MGDNKKWYLNLRADWVYGCARKVLYPHEREKIDALLRLLFYDSPDQEASQRPRQGPEQSYLYAPALVDHILAHRDTDLEPLRRVIPRARLAADDFGRQHGRELWEPDTFLWWVGVWLDLFANTRAQGPERALLMWVWL